MSTRGITTFSHVSDTARFVALLRAMESERPDALFHDPFARKLAGDAAASVFSKLRAPGRFDANVMAVRTQVIDEIVLRLVREENIDAVVNLAAGLDTRPFRLALPPALEWFDVDLPGILDHKVAQLAGTPPKPWYEILKVDLTDDLARGEVLDQISDQCSRALVLTEGLLMYLKPEDVIQLGRDLHARGCFQYWVMDLLHPRELRWLQRKYGETLDAANASVHFAPPNGAAYFKPLGWEVVENHPFAVEAHRLNRETKAFRFLRRTERFLPPPLRNVRRTSYGCAVLKRR